MNRTMAAVVALMMVAGVAATALGAPDPVSAVADTAAANAKALTIGQGLAIFGASVGSGLAVLGGALGIGRIGGTVAPEFEEQITPALRSAERAAFGMRMTDGVPAELVCGRFDRQVAKLISTGLACWHDGRLCPTRRGILFADEVATEFV